MDIVKIQERREGFAKGIEDINKKLEILRSEYAKLEDMKKTTLGAIADCDYWIKQLSDTSNGDESE